MNPYEKDIEVDQHDLMKECYRQPMLVNKYGGIKSHISEKVSKLKRRLKERKSNVFIEAKLNPEKFGFTSASDKVAENLAQIDEEVKKLSEELEVEEKKLSLVETAMLSIEHRRTVIRDIKDQLLSGLYSSTDEMESEKFKQLTKRMSEKITNDLKRRTYAS